MNEIIEPRNVGNVCRLCLSAQEPKSSVFADEAIAGVPLATKIQTCLSIEILISDRVSTSVCTDCSKRVDEWYTYKEYCLRSQEKLKQCLTEPSTDGLANIKAEPPDYEETPSQPETADASDDEDEDATDDIRERRIKREVAEDEKAACAASPDGGQLLLNPMAVGGHREEEEEEDDDDDGREIDATEKSTGSARRGGRRKRSRRGRQTHFRGSRRYKQRCFHCQIYLHSKWSYAKHTERFHSGDLGLSVDAAVAEPLVVLTTESNDKKRKATEMTRADDIEDVEDVEEELISLEKDAPLTPVQRNIISQLKTFSCYTCGLCFADRRSTLNHIRQHMPDLRPYTCIACLTEFADRSVYKLHCGASFECAMKIALVVPEHGTEKYFTCNMCLRSLPNRKDLLSHLSRHSDRQYEQLTAAPPPPPPPPLLPVSVAKRRKLSRDRVIPAPYKNGDPAHNHTCLDCGMIYRYKQNQLKHVALCKTLPAEKRICYRCVDCGLTFLAFNKFQSHVNLAHGKRQIACHRCGCKFAIDHFLSHYREHYATENSTESEDARGSSHGMDLWSNETMGALTTMTTNKRWNEPPTGGLSYSTNSRARHVDDESKMARREEGERRIARENGRYSIKMDPGGSSDVECRECGKVFANYTNLRRHARTVHEDGVGRYSCFTCAKTFVREEEWTEHVETEHRREAERAEICPLCPSAFESRQELLLHRRAVHGTDGEDRLACYICGKCFASETSLKIHRGHHFRVNSRLSIGGKMAERANANRTRSSQDGAHVGPLVSPRARKTFPNGGGTGSPASADRSRESLQCQVCDVRFDNVSDLGRHLWDVHCSRAKPEKPFTTDELRCELCTNVLPDEESLRSHLEWHEQNPILSNARAQKREPEVPVRCDQCGKYYSSIGNLRKHKKRHVASGWSPEGCRVRKRGPQAGGFTCEVCRKVFASRSILAKHRVSAHSRFESSPPPLLPFAPRDSKKSLACHLCGKIQADVRALAKHARVVHKISNANSIVIDRPESPPPAPRVSCTLCSKLFGNLANMRQHFTKVHGKTRIENRNAQQHQQQYQPQELRCEVEGCKRLFESRLAKLNHEKTHVNVVYTCALCPRHTLNPGAMAEHILAAHRANRVSGYDKMTLCKKMDLDKYVVVGANGRQCPVCAITYPNYKALKIHYLKIHEDEASSV